MREIKFRAWDKKRKQMFRVVEISYHDDINVNHIYSVTKSAEDITEKYEEDEYLIDGQFDLMQYTGLKDKNGTEIYEGDIVTINVPTEHYTIQGNGWTDVDEVPGFKLKGVVRFLHNCWFLEEENEKGCPLDFDTNQTTEIIGNIYENPELLGDDGNARND